jgi:hypothetical protein
MDSEPLLSVQINKLISRQYSQRCTVDHRAIEQSVRRHLGDISMMLTKTTCDIMGLVWHQASVTASV